MIVVADTTPLNYLMLIGEIELLPQLFGWVLIPFAVFEELNQAETPGAVRNWMANPPPWLEVRILRSRPADALDYLDQGEREAIALAEETHADRLLIDETEAAEKPLDGTYRLSVSSAFCEKAPGEAFWIFLLRWHACKQRRFT